MLKNLIVLSTFLTALCLIVLSPQVQSQEQIARLDVETLSEGVFLVRDHDGERIEAFGIGGMNLALRDMELVIFDSNGDAREGVEPHVLKTYDDLANAVLAQKASESERLEGVSRSYYSYVEDSGSVCGVRYGLEASTNRSGFWYMRGLASAWFQGNGGIGPPAPAGHTVKVQAQLILTQPNGNQIFIVDSDEQHYNVWGEVAVNVDSGLGPSGSCMQADASAFVWYAACLTSSDNFRYISTNGSLHC